MLPPSYVLCCGGGYWGVPNGWSPFLGIDAAFDIQSSPRVTFAPVQFMDLDGTGNVGCSGYPASSDTGGDAVDFAVSTDEFQNGAFRCVLEAGTSPVPGRTLKDASRAIAAEMRSRSRWAIITSAF